MTIRSTVELEGLGRIGRIVGRALRAMQAIVRPGVTTAELDQVCAEFLRRHGASSTPRREYGFPGWACISVNDEVVHGIPGGRALLPGDIVKLDVTADLDGYVADAARTVIVEPRADEAVRLAECALAAFQEAAALATAGRQVREVGRAVEAEARRWGFNVVRELCGHGVGRRVHEPPNVPNYFDWRCESRLKDGLVITIEPIITAGSGKVLDSGDGWTLRTADGCFAAHHEETIVVTRGRAIVLTAA